MRKLIITALILFVCAPIFAAGEPLLKQKRTCEECRKLADKGAYEESIKAYKEFIETHKDSFQIDDAYFAIADLYDTKLFDYANALEWYAKLKKDYSNSTLVALANQRVAYITSYADYEYKPLASFERIRSFEYAQKKELPAERDKILAEVDSLIMQYPDSNLAPVMQHWLANQYRLFAPDKAVDAYMTLRKNYPNHNESKESMLEIGETYYDAARYKEAVTAFKLALKENPELEKTITSQINRANRNIHRTNLAHISLVICIVILSFAFVAPPRRMKLSMIIRCTAIFLLAAGLLFAGAWQIRSEFNTFNQLLLFVIFFAICISLATLISLGITHKFNDTLPAAFTGSVFGLIFLLAGLYVTIYYVYVHYLIVFKL
jgi:tetratricopeptide (TPR) repeat protein